MQTVVHLGVWNVLIFAVDFPILGLSFTLFGLVLTMIMVLRHQLPLHKLLMHSMLDEGHFQNEEAFKSLNYTIGHDLKSPVRNLQRIFERFREKNNHLLDPEGKQEVEQLSVLIQDAAAMLDGILHYSTQDQLDLTCSTFQTQRVVSYLAQCLQDGNQDRELIFEIQDLPDQVGDPLMLRQVFDNLLQNAVKFSAQAKPAEITIGCTSFANWNEFFIQDNGIGIPSESTSRIFELFKTAHDRTAFKGTGVGLAIVKRIVERHQGQIWVEPNLPCGSIFKIRLPRSL